MVAMQQQTLATLLRFKWQVHYSLAVMHWVRFRISIAIQRWVNTCIRGSRSLSSLSKSSPGLDGLPEILFRRLSSSLSVPLSAIINSCILHSSLPTCFTINMIQLRFKQTGPKNTMTSYRSIAYTLVVTKILENYVQPKLFAQVDKPFHLSTHGFLPQRGPELILSLSTMS